MKDAYWYDLPKEMIATQPAEPRDSSKLLIYNTATDEIQIDTFVHLADHFPPTTTFILNDAKVVPARVTLTKQTGGKIIVLFLINEWLPHPHDLIPCFVDRKTAVGEKLFFADKTYVIVEKQEENMFFCAWSGTAPTLIEQLNTYGTMPIPPYIKNTPLNRDELMEKYQTIFAKNAGSSAAPTASLHFTDRVFQSLEQKGIRKEFVTLHVGLGTFAPLTEENLRTETLHKEWCEVPEKTYRFFEKSIQSGTKKAEITAVGTTVVRTLESYALHGTIGQPYAGDTTLFIRPGFQFQLVDHLVTNFHLPSSSLMMLVDAFLAHKKAKTRILPLYEYAKAHAFRFYSFGDAMLIL